MWIPLSDTNLAVAHGQPRSALDEDCRRRTVTASLVGSSRYVLINKRPWAHMYFSSHSFHWSLSFFTFIRVFNHEGTSVLPNLWLLFMHFYVSGLDNFLLDQPLFSAKYCFYSLFARVVILHHVQPSNCSLTSNLSYGVN